MNIRNILLLATVAVATSACNDIAEDERYIPIESVDAKRAVLIEDFTGQNCVNCPDAHATIEALVEQYGDAVIPVSIHAGAFGIPATNKRYTGLMQPEGDTYNNAWGITSWPMGVVNRVGGATEHTAWATAVRTALETPTPLEIEMTATCPEGSSDIAIDITCSQTEDINGYLQVWIIENGIVARQESATEGRINNYVHNNVYRASTNGVGGEPVALKAMIHQSFSYTQELRATATETWVPDNLQVVAFVYNAAGVVQAARTDVITNTNQNED